MALKDQPTAVQKLIKLNEGKKAFEATQRKKKRKRKKRNNNHLYHPTSTKKAVDNKIHRPYRFGGKGGISLKKTSVKTQPEAILETIS